jgi:hypothetical protein
MFRRKRNRVKMVLAVRVLGRAAAGAEFDELVHTLDIAIGGARLGGVERLPLQPGDTLEIRRKNRRASFRVKWVGGASTPKQGQIGVEAIDAPTDFWGLEVPIEGEAPIPSLGRIVHQVGSTG